MAVMKRGKNFLKYISQISYYVTRYPLPIGAVDTHRPKPGALVQESITESTSRREYYGDR